MTLLTHYLVYRSKGSCISIQQHPVRRHQFHPQYGISRTRGGSSPVFLYCTLLIMYIQRGFSMLQRFLYCDVHQAIPSDGETITLVCCISLTSIGIQVYQSLPLCNTVRIYRVWLSTGGEQIYSTPLCSTWCSATSRKQIYTSSTRANHGTSSRQIIGLL